MSRALLAVVAVALAVAGIEFYALTERGRPHSSVPLPAVPSATPAPASSPSAPAIGWIDSPIGDTVVGPAVEVNGWALDRAGVAAVEVRLDARRFPATTGIARADVAQANPGYPDSSTAGFAFAGDFSAELAADSSGVHTLAIVVVARDGRETVLAQRRLVAPAAMMRWRALLEGKPRLATRTMRFLMMSSGVAAGGGNGIRATYRPYLSRTMRIGLSVPILYLRTTTGARGDWMFDPDFDLAHKCRDRAVAEDALDGVIAFAIANDLPVQFILNGGIWADASCDIPEWDVNDHLEQDIANCQWTQNNEVLPDDYRANLPGSTPSPELARSLTYNVYATKVRHYKRRNLQAAAAIIAGFARAHPALFAGVVLDADTYMNPFVREGRWYDYNPGMLKQFRHWLAGSGPYAGVDRSVPDLSSYRRVPALSLADVNRLARRQWPSWDDVDPPRTFPGDGTTAVAPGAEPFWKDPWHREWDSFRRHVVALHYDELAGWVHAMGIPRDRIFSAQAFIAPDPGRRPVALHIRGPSPDYDSAGVSIEGAIPREGHLGTILYGPAAENRHPMEDGRGLFATLARMDPGWGIVEYNATDLKAARRPADVCSDLSHAARSLQLRRQPDRDDGVERLQRAVRGAAGLRRVHRVAQHAGRGRARRLPRRSRRPAARRAAVDLRDAAACGRRRLVARPGAPRRRPGLCRSRARRGGRADVTGRSGAARRWRRYAGAGTRESRRRCARAGVRAHRRHGAVDRADGSGCHDGAAPRRGRHRGAAGVAGGLAREAQHRGPAANRAHDGDGGRQRARAADRALSARHRSQPATVERT